MRRPVLIAALALSACTSSVAAPADLLAAALAPKPSAAMSLIPVPVQACCKRCSKGKACGDSCIARDKTCHKAPGCACDV